MGFSRAIDSDARQALIALAGARRRGRYSSDPVT